MRRAGLFVAIGSLVALAVPTAAPADTVTLSNANGIDFAAGDPSVHPGDPYPSVVTGPAGTVNDVNVSISQSHANPDDLDIQLVSPNGTGVFLQSDACQADSNVFHPIAFDDSGVSFLSDAGNCLSANNPYKPSNYEVGDIYSTPAPAAPLNALSFFNGGPSGGQWGLFTMDDTTGNGGSISGWSITLDYTPTPPVTPTPPPLCAGQPATIVGTAAAETLTGTAGPDVIAGLQGKDVIRGLAGDDLICGGEGKDKLLGGAGKDRLLGEQGKDTLKGGPGKDKLIGGPGKDSQTQ